jgi:lysozyme family protein
MARFEEVMATVFKWEGGFVNNPFDNGGPTNMGITHTVLAAWRGVAGVTVAEVRNLTRAEATEIYRDRYWTKIRGEALPQPIDLIVMDGAVNHSVDRMAKFLQQAVGVEDDGDIGSDTLTAVSTKTSSQEGLFDLVVALAEKRKHRYVTHEDAQHFIAGWRNRLNDVMMVALDKFSIAWTFKDGRTVKDGSTPGPIEPGPISSVIRPVIEDVELQAALMTVGLYRDDIDGIFCENSIKAMDAFLTQKATLITGNWKSWNVPRRKLTLAQLICRELDIDVGRIDGLFGPTCDAAFEAFNRKRLGLPPDKWRDELDQLPPPTGPVTPVTTWPRESDVPTFFGPLGSECTAVPLKRLRLPFKMRLAWALGTEIESFNVHTKVHDSAARVFDKVLAHYRDDGIEELGLNLFGGCTSCRRKSGGSSWSMHAWSIAIDFDPGRNALSWNHTRARLARPDAVKFWEFWEAEGWVSLGRTRDFDWMHIQAARL